MTVHGKRNRRGAIVLICSAGDETKAPLEVPVWMFDAAVCCKRANAMISIAHPDFRDGLEREAYDQRLIPRGVSFLSRRNTRTFQESPKFPVN